MALSANIRAQRRKAGMTQIELAEKIGVSIATLRRWESGETAPNGTRIIEMANTLGITPEEIISGVEIDEKQYRLKVPTVDENSGMLVYEGEGVRLELPPNEKSYELLEKLVENTITNKLHLSDEHKQLVMDVYNSDPRFKPSPANKS